MAEKPVDNLALEIVLVSEKAMEALDKLVAKIDKTTNGLGKMSEETKDVRDKSKKLGDEGGRGMDKFTKATEKASKAMNGLKKLVGAAVLLRTFRKLIEFGIKGFAEISSYVENYNLFLVSMREHHGEAIKFQNELNNAWGTNISQSMKYQGFYMNLSTALGIARDTAYDLSEALTLMTYDMASLFNWTPDVAYQRLQAGIVGQTKPLRYAGIDVTQQTIQPILDELGIDTWVTDLTQAEKVLLRSISIWRQTANVQGDYTRTIETAANQQKIFNEQVKEMTRWFGGTFVGAIKGVLPYLNAVVMTLKEIFKWLALMTGFTMADMGVSNLEDLSDGFSMIGDEADAAAGAIARAKIGLRGFDEINNITTPSSGGNVGIGATSAMIILQEELNRMLEEYRDNMKVTEYSAYAIRDRMLEWLGFSKEINEETGEVTFKFQGIQSPALKNLMDSLRNLRDSMLDLASAIWDRLRMVWDEVIVPIGAFTISNVLPSFFEFFSATLDLFTEILNGNKGNIQWFLSDILLPLSILSLTVVAESLDFLTGVLRDFTQFLKEDQKRMDFFFGALSAFILFMVSKTVAVTFIGVIYAMTGAFTGLAVPFTILNIQTLLVVTAFGLLAYAIGGIASAWSDMSGLERVIAVLGLLMAAAAGAAIAVGALQSAWSLGIAAAAIVAGISAILYAVNSATNRADKFDTSAMSGGGGGWKAPSGGAGGWNNAGTGFTSGNPSTSTQTTTREMPREGIQMRAGGGYVDTGQMFIAREAGAELLGTIGNKTAVMNNEQIVASVSRGVASAVSAVMNSGRDVGEQTIVMQVDDIEFGKATIRAIGKTQRLTGVTIT